MSFNDDFDDLFGDFGIFGSKFIKKLEMDMDRIFEEVRSGKIKGDWQIKQIEEPGVSGYIIQGRFSSDKSLEPLEPLKPWKRPPLPEKPFGISKATLKEMREPLTDVFEEKDSLKVYVELPGEEKDDIKMDNTKNHVEIKTKNFQKTVELPKINLDIEKASTEYKNGVLKITIPKKSF